MTTWKKVPAELAAAFDAALPPAVDVERRKMFGCPTAFVNGNLFAGLHEDAGDASADLGADLGREHRRDRAVDHHRLLELAALGLDVGVDDEPGVRGGAGPDDPGDAKR